MLLKRSLKLLLIASKPAVSRNFSQEYVPKALRSLKAKSTRNTVQFYVDSARVRTVGGNGGDGCISFLSAWCKDQAGPDGGDGGHGGHVIFQATHTVKSLNHCRAAIIAKHGERGFNKDCNGKNAAHVIVPVPLGTIVKDANGVVVGDLSAEGTMFVAARGGVGGRGNKFFLTDTQQAPDLAELGAVGETNQYTLEVRSMAHIGLLGFPNAGKSTLLRALTRARPTVAPHPFTTLKPHIGMVPYDDYEQVAIADLPGLIPGSHKNRGLGIQFLQHVERCRGLIFLLDGTDDPLYQYQNLTYELSQYNSSLSNRPSCIVVNKIDLKEGRIGLEEVKRHIGDVLSEASEDCDVIGDSKDVIGVSEDVIRVSKDVIGVSKDVIGVSKDVIGVSEDVIRVSEDVIRVSEDVIKASKDVIANSNEMMAQLSSEIEDSEGRVSKTKDVTVIGISAKTGLNLSQLLRLVRQMYDNGGQS